MQEGLFLSVLSSSGAGLVSRFICHPIDTLKARIQASSSSAGSAKGDDFGGLYRALRTTVAEEGVRGLYRGLGAVLIGGIPATSVYLTTYEVAKNQFESKQSPIKDSPFLSYFLAGIVAEAISCIVFVPVDVIKERMQIQRPTSVLQQSVANTSPNALTSALNGGDISSMPTPYKSGMHAVRTILKEEGVAGIYRGYFITMLSFGPFSALYFVFYEELKAAALRYRLDSSRGRMHTGTAPHPEEAQLNPSATSLPFEWTMAVSSVAGSLAAAITSPLDMAKLRIQISRRGGAVTGKESGATVGSVLGDAFRREGFVGLFRGAGARVAFHAPNVAITMASFEYIKNLLTKANVE